MKRILAAGTAMLLSMGYAGVAHADMIVIDNFQSPQRSVSDNTADGNAVTGPDDTYTVFSPELNKSYEFTRTLSVNQFENGSGGNALSSSAVIGFGTLELENAPRTNSLIDLSYDIDSIADDVAGVSQLMMNVIFADVASGVEFSIEVFLNDTRVDSQTFTGPGQMSIDLPALAASGNELRLQFSGGAGWDATLGSLRLEIGDGNEIPVPEPATIGLLGLGLATVAFRRRRKVAA